MSLAAVDLFAQKHPAILGGLYLQGHRPLRTTTIPGRDDTI
jgi:hypothetical protein